MNQYSTAWQAKRSSIVEYLSLELDLPTDVPRILEITEEVSRRSLDVITRKAISEERGMNSVFFNQTRLAIVREKKTRKSGRTLVRRSEQEANAIVSAAFEQHYANLVRYATSRVQDADRAEELASDAFLDLREALLNGRYDTSIDAILWLMSSLKNRISNAVRQSHALPISFDVPDWDESRDPQSVAARNETADAVRAVLEQLPEIARQALLLLAEGVSLTEIASRLELSLRDARALLEQAQAQAQVALA